jgi:hypothetical protein
MRKAAQLSGDREDRMRQLNNRAAANESGEESEYVDAIVDPDATPATEINADVTEVQPSRNTNIGEKADAEFPEQDTEEKGDSSATEMAALQKGFANNINDLGRTLTSAIGQHTPILHKQTQQLTGISGSTGKMLGLMYAKSRQMDVFRQPSNDSSTGPAGEPEKKKDDRKNYDDADFSSSITSLGLGVGGAAGGFLGLKKLKEMAAKRLGLGGGNASTTANGTPPSAGRTAGGSPGGGTNASSSDSTNTKGNADNERSSRRPGLRGKVGAIAKVASAAAGFFGAYQLSDALNGDAASDDNTLAYRDMREETDARLLAQTQGRELSDNEVAEVRFASLKKQQLLPEQQEQHREMTRQRARISVDPEYAKQYSAAKDSKAQGREYDKAFDVPLADLSSWTEERKRAELVQGQDYEDTFGGSMTAGLVGGAAVVALGKKLESVVSNITSTSTPPVPKTSPAMRALPSPSAVNGAPTTQSPASRALPSPSAGNGATAGNTRSNAVPAKSVMGKVPGLIGALLSAVELGSIWTDDTISLEEKQKETAVVGGGVAGAWGGGVAGASGGAALGASLGSIVPILGTAVGGAVGGFVGGIGGSILGYMGGSEITDMAYEEVIGKPEPLTSTGADVDAIISSSVSDSTKTFEEKVSEKETAITNVLPFQTQVASASPTNNITVAADKPKAPVVGQVSRADRPQVITETKVMESKREREYLEQIAAKAEKQHGIPSGVLRSLLEKESGYNATAINRNGKQGIMQLNPAVHQNVDTQDAEKSITYGAQYLQQLYTKTGNWEEAVALYSNKQTDYGDSVVSGASNFGDSNVTSITKPVLSAKGNVKTEVVAGDQITATTALREGPVSTSVVNNSQTMNSNSSNPMLAAINAAMVPATRKMPERPVVANGSQTRMEQNATNNVTHIGTSTVGTEAGQEANVENISNSTNTASEFSTTTQNEQTVTRQQHDPVKKVMMLGDNSQAAPKRNISLDDLKNNKRIQAVAPNITSNITDTPTLSMDFGIMAFNTGFI